MKKICYGLAIPGLIVGCVLYTHMPAKYSESRLDYQVFCWSYAVKDWLMTVLVRILGKTRHLSENTPTHYIVWLYVKPFLRSYILYRILLQSLAPPRSSDRRRLTTSSCVLFNCIISFLIAEAIPFFNDLVGLIGALLGTFICM